MYLLFDLAEFCRGRMSLFLRFGCFSTRTALIVSYRTGFRLCVVGRFPSRWLFFIFRIANGRRHHCCRYMHTHLFANGYICVYRYLDFNDPQNTVSNNFRMRRAAAEHVPHEQVVIVV